MFLRKLVMQVLLLGICGVVLSINSVAQYRAGVQGVVTDPSGAVVSGATVTLTSNETNRTRTTTTSDSGVYTILGLAPGHYKLSVDKAGFQKKEIPDLLVNAEQVQGANVQMTVGGATQAVTVSAEATPALQTESASIAGTITSRDVQSLPSYGRDPFQLLQLAPGTFGDNARNAGGGANNLPGNAGPGGVSQSSSIFQTENQVQVSANGQRTTANSYQIDGVSVNSLAWGGAAVVTPNEESVKEVRVESNSYSAENGRAGGAQVMVVSKNGTNEWHGSGLLRVARPGLNAFQRWNGPNAQVQRATDRFNQWAASVGGPIIKNKLFFFFSYETLRNGSTNVGSGWYETPQFLSLVQSKKPGSLAAKIAGFPGEGVSFSSISQTANCAQAGITPCADIFSGGQLIGLDVGSPLTSALGTPDPTFGAAGTPFGVGGGLDGIPDIFFVNTTQPVKSNAQQYNGRVDFQVTNSDLLAFSMYYVPVKSNFYNGPTRPANFWTNDRKNWASTILWNHTFSSMLLNEARISASRWSWNEVTSNPQEPFGLPTGNINALNTANVQFLGAPSGSIFAQTTYNFRDTASLMHHGQSLKFGADIYWEQNNDSQIWSARPSYSFTNLWSWANDAPYQESGNFDPSTGAPTGVLKHIRSKIYSFFVQDDWKARPNLTLNLGLRWEYFGPITETNGKISNAILGSGPNTLTGLRLKLGGNLYDSSKNNWGPQIGFAWTPWRDKSNFVLRGGFGIGFTRMEEAITLNGRSNPPFVSGLTLTGANVLYTAPSDVHAYFGWPSNPAAQATFDPVTNLPVAGAPVDINIFPQDLPTPTTYRYSLDTQYQFPWGLVATLGYQGSQMRHYTRQTNLNWFFPTARNAALNNVWYYVNDVNGNYNALLASVQRRLSRTFSFDFSYRWAKAIDEGSNEYYIGEFPFNVHDLRGPADYDVRHNVKLFTIWSPQFFKGNNMLEKIAGGWDISGVLNWHSGFPFNPVYNVGSCDIIYAGSGYCNLRPAAYLGGAGNDQSNGTFQQQGGNFPGNPNQYFTPPTVVPGAVPTAPGLGRNAFRGPQYFNVDMSLQKAFGLPSMKFLGENARFEFRADFFNILNKLNVTNINNTIGTAPTLGAAFAPNATFGQAQAALGGRTINLQARFSF